MYHTHGNLKTKHQRSDIVTLFREIVNAYNFKEFSKFMVEIENKSHDVWEYLTVKVGVEY